MLQCRSALELGVGLHRCPERIVQYMAQCCDIAGLYEAVDFADNTAEQMGVDGKARVLKDCSLDQI